MREEARNQQIEQVGRELREMMTFLKKKKESGVPEEQLGGAPKMKIFTFDTTLRDGTQGESVSFSVDDKLRSRRNSMRLGIDYIEGAGRDRIPRTRISLRGKRELKLKHAKLTAFGSTRFARECGGRGPRTCGALIEAQADVVSIFGKSWDLHTRRALGMTEEENLDVDLGDGRLS